MGIAHGKARINLLPLAVDHVDRDAIRVKKAQDLALEVDQDFVDVFCSMNLVGNIVKGLVVGELLLMLGTVLGDLRLHDWAPLWNDSP